MTVVYWDVQIKQNWPWVAIIGIYNDNLSMLLIRDTMNHNYKKYLENK